MKRCKHGKPCQKHMLEASRELAELVKRYGDALDEVSHRDLVKAANTLRRRSMGLRSVNPGGNPSDDGALDVRVKS